MILLTPELREQLLASGHQRDVEHTFDQALRLYGSTAAADSRHCRDRIRIGSAVAPGRSGNRE